jgi:hypothetical protein
MIGQSFPLSNLERRKKMDPTLLVEGTLYLALMTGLLAAGEFLIEIGARFVYSPQEHGR